MQIHASTNAMKKWNLTQRFKSFPSTKFYNKYYTLKLYFQSCVNIRSRSIILKKIFLYPQKSRELPVSHDCDFHTTIAKNVKLAALLKLLHSIALRLSRYQLFPYDAFLIFLLSYLPTHFPELRCSLDLRRKQDYAHSRTLAR